MVFWKCAKDACIDNYLHILLFAISRLTPTHFSIKCPKCRQMLFYPYVCPNLIKFVNLERSIGHHTCFKFNARKKNPKISNVLSNYAILIKFHVKHRLSVVVFLRWTKWNFRLLFATMFNVRRAIRIIIPFIWLYCRSYYVFYYYLYLFTRRVPWYVPRHLFFCVEINKPKYARVNKFPCVHSPQSARMSKTGPVCDSLCVCCFLGGFDLNKNFRCSMQLCRYTKFNGIIYE